jgi:hypothetical protein
MDQAGLDARSAFDACVQEAGRQYGLGSQEFVRLSSGMSDALSCLIIKGLAGCPSELPAPPAPPSPSPAPPSTTATPEGEPNPLAEGTRYDGFKTPSGNIVCWVFDVIDSAKPFQLECAVLSAAKTWVLPQTERVTVVDEVKTDRMAPILAYGHRWHLHSLSCTSRSKGLSCSDAQTGHGFFLSRDTQRVF